MDMSLSAWSARCVILAGAAALGTAAPASAISLTSNDTFTDGTTMGWVGGTTITNNTGGPGGAADRFLRVDANGGGSGPGSKVASHNGDPRWIGDYLGSGVTALQCDMRNEGNAALEMRVVLFGLGTRYTSVTSVNLPVGGAWQTVTFPVGQSSLTQVLGSVAYNDMITNVTGLMFRHDPGTPSSQGASADGTVGIDNVRAIPAPGAMGVLLLGALASRRRR